MSSYTTEVDKLEQEMHHLRDLLNSHSFAEGDEYTLELAISVAKRVRRQSGSVVRALAKYRDKLET
jgi:hypothetical protein